MSFSPISSRYPTSGCNLPEMDRTGLCGETVGPDPGLTIDVTRNPSLFRLQKVDINLNDSVVKAHLRTASLPESQSCAYLAWSVYLPTWMRRIDRHLQV